MNTIERHNGLPVSITVALEPVYNVLNSLSLLNDLDNMLGLNTWVTQTVNDLTVEQRHTHKLVFIGLRDVLTPLRGEPNFPSYLYNLGEVNPFLIRKMVVEPLRKRFSRRVTYATPSTKVLFNDVQTYLDCVRQVQGEHLFDEEIHREVHALLQDPPVLQQLVLSHLEMLWKTAFAAEWRRVQSMLQYQVDMFSRALRGDESIEKTFSELTGRFLPKNVVKVANHAEEVIFIPSWHTGRHVTTWDGADWEEGWSKLIDTTTIRVFFSEPPNYDVTSLRSTPVQRAELCARMNALGDETRLQILELVAQNDELSAQEIIAALNLGQSSVSRHLKQLVSMGYLYERRGGEGANKTYRLSSFYIGRTIQALQRLIQIESMKPQTEVQGYTGEVFG